MNALERKFPGPAPIATKKLGISSAIACAMRSSCSAFVIEGTCSIVFIRSARNLAAALCQKTKRAFQGITVVREPLIPIHRLEPRRPSNENLLPGFAPGIGGLQNVRDVRLRLSTLRPALR